MRLQGARLSAALIPRVSDFLKYVLVLFSSTN